MEGEEKKVSLGCIKDCDFAESRTTSYSDIDHTITAYLGSHLLEISSFLLVIHSFLSSYRLAFSDRSRFLHHGRHLSNHL